MDFQNMREGTMKINLEKNLVEFNPESAEEKAKMETIWRLLVDCVGSSRKLVPVGEYVPGKNSKGATFYIEGLADAGREYTEIHVEEDCVCYCSTCNKQVSLKKGDPIPLCCGKLMEIID
jgi:hypothetical protein